MDAHGSVCTRQDACKARRPHPVVPENKSCWEDVVSGMFVFRTMSTGLVHGQRLPTAVRLPLPIIVERKKPRGLNKHRALLNISNLAPISSPRLVPTTSRSAGLGSTQQQSSYPGTQAKYPSNHYWSLGFNPSFAFIKTLATKFRHVPVPAPHPPPGDSLHQGELSSDRLQFIWTDKAAHCSPSPASVLPSPSTSQYLDLFHFPAAPSHPVLVLIDSNAATFISSNQKYTHDLDVIITPLLLFSFSVFRNFESCHRALTSPLLRRFDTIFICSTIVTSSFK
ncbi:hypothetical protein A9K55_003212 [Cordyceps militaris]|uniref:Uncharacterized protein n=1 Tax=Cordyceps militaris TaxID=73501 RepID=A0A2H4S861_CORMI|nr:hypothetical protein A9K55_003212 [Cordyceps militaris]